MEQKELNNVVTEISAKAGQTFFRNGVYYKCEYMETRILKNDSNNEIERNDLWNTVNLEIDKQYENIKKLSEKI